MRAHALLFSFGIGSLSRAMQLRRDPNDLSTSRRIAGSRFTATTPANVIPNLPRLLRKMSAKLQQVWRFETRQNQQIKASPIVAGGVIYITTPDNIWAVDARTAKELWHYQNPPNNAFHIGHRGAAIYKDTVYLDHPGLSPDRAECQRRKGQMGRRDCRFQQRLLGDERSSRRAESRAGRPLRRFR